MEGLLLELRSESPLRATAPLVEVFGVIEPLRGEQIFNHFPETNLNQGVTSVVPESWESFPDFKISYYLIFNGDYKILCFFGMCINKSGWTIIFLLLRALIRLLKKYNRLQRNLFLKINRTLFLIKIVIVII